MSKLLKMSALLALSVSLSGCVAAVVGGAAVAGLTIAQERSVGDAVDDTVVDTSVNSALLQEQLDLFRNVSVNVVEGRVLLTGVVETPEERLKAAQIAWDVKGVRDVINEILVEEETDVIDFARDTWITTQIRGRLLADSDIYDVNFTIETVNTIVYLFGIAQSSEEVMRAIYHAQRVKGVKRVISHMMLKDDPGRTPSP
ncbi:MAG: BON domain-containing protein [Alphaproteobacteria bacterium]